MESISLAFLNSYFKNLEIGEYEDTIGDWNRPFKNTSISCFLKFQNCLSYHTYVISTIQRKIQYILKMC